MKQRRRRHARAYLAPLLVLAVIAGAGFYFLGVLERGEPPGPPVGLTGSAGPKPAAERTATLPALNLPADDAIHGSGMEWWYYSGILDAQPTGNRYAFHVAVFVANALVKHTVMQVAMTDLQTGQRYTRQSRTAGLPAQLDKAGFDFRQDGWQVSGSGPMHSIKTEFDGVELTLQLRDEHPVVAHRASGSQTPGLLDFGESGISYYYSRPRMSATGEVRVGKQASAQALKGTVWFDHQWGDFDVTRLGWNWLALHLSDGSDVMVYQLFDREGHGIVTTGTLTRTGASRPLAPGEVSLTPMRTWTSPRSKIEYAVDWKLQLPTGEHHIQPFFDNSEFDASASSANIYWEGPVRVSGSAKGEGFMELSGYERLRPTPAASSK
ncbi:lipocalin family protein [Variovorax sp. OV329]|uniref:lipocalin family protein n=1 Tax=Variovorax sp. OV329 TaxID=1882825 RepID=UPI0008ED74FC|nr:lipocalin family protein [Variovorax sp. OV329]SFN10190.1 Predicted secreted hydrolase [Variovorax sp. OV329]